MNDRKLWNENHKKLTNLILNPNEHANVIELFLSQHALLYSSKMGNTQVSTIEDELFKDIREETLRKYPVLSPDTKNSIVWHIWHITRIEDMTMNILVSNNVQVLNAGDWQNELKINVAHSGNGMLEEEVNELSSNIDINALLSYRLEVGRKTREIVKLMEPGQFKQRVDRERLKKLIEQGAVMEEAAWLIEYWGNKNLAGLILMPATRHNFFHLNKCIRIKHKSKN